MARGYAITLPVGWHRLSLSDDDQAVVRSAEHRFLTRDDDSARSALARHRFRETVTRLVARARATGVVDLFVHAGPSRTGIGPMSLAVSVVAGTGLDTEDRLVDDDDPVAPRFVRVSLPAGPALRRARREAVPLADVVDDVIAVGDPEACASDADAARRRGQGHETDSASLDHLIALPDSAGACLMLSFRAIGGPHVEAELHHADSIVRTLRWT